MQIYLPRVADKELSELFAQVPAVLLDGAKGVGKTATAEQRVATIIRLDDPAERAVAEADPFQSLKRPFPILIDEWQRLPAIWDVVRRAVDADRSPNRFLLTGSASPAHPAHHSGAGRIVNVRMRPMTLVERAVGQPSVSLQLLLFGGRPPLDGYTDVSLADYTREILASGFPGLRRTPDRVLRASLDSYLARIVDCDFEEQERPLRNPMALLRWMRAYAAASSTTASFETIRDAATSGQREKPAKSTTTMYRDVLERLWIIEPVPAWLPTRNHLAALAVAPKHQLVDPALAARLLGVDTGALLHGTSATVKERVSTATEREHALRDGALLGRLFESLVTLNTRVYAQSAEATVHHLRTHEGRHEVDLLVVRGDQRVVAIEVKMGAVVTDDDVRHLRWLREKLGDDELLDAIVITTGTRAYRRSDGIGVIPAALLGP